MPLVVALVAMAAGCTEGENVTPVCGVGTAEHTVNADRKLMRDPGCSWTDLVPFWIFRLALVCLQ